MSFEIINDRLSTSSNGITMAIIRDNDPQFGQSRFSSKMHQNLCGYIQKWIVFAIFTMNFCKRKFCCFYHKYFDKNLICIFFNWISQKILQCQISMNLFYFILCYECDCNRLKNGKIANFFLFRQRFSHSSDMRFVRNTLETLQICSHSMTHVRCENILDFVYYRTKLSCQDLQNVCLYLAAGIFGGDNKTGRTLHLFFFENDILIKSRAIKCVRNNIQMGADSYYFQMGGKERWPPRCCHPYDNVPRRRLFLFSKFKYIEVR